MDSRKQHYEIFSKNFVYNQTFLADYYKDYDSFQQHPKLTIGLITLISFYILVGPLGNIAIIGAIYTNKVLWKPLNLFIINLSLADLIEVTVISSTSITGLTIGHQVFLQNHRLCNIIANICVTSCVTSLLTHMSIAVTRYLSIKYHSHFINLATWKSTSIACVCIWIIAFLLQLPPDVGWGRNVYDLKAMICIWDRTYSVGYTLYFAIVYVLFPISTIFYCYIRLFMHVRGIRKVMEANAVNPGDGHQTVHEKENYKKHTNMNQKRWKQEMKLASTLFAHFLIVFILWGQYAFIVMVDFKNRLPATVHASTVQVAHAIAVVNVFVYLTNKSFRIGMISFLTKKPLELLGSTSYHVPAHTTKIGTIAFHNSSNKGNDDTPNNTVFMKSKGVAKIDSLERAEANRRRKSKEVFGENYLKDEIPLAVDKITGHVEEIGLPPFERDVYTGPEKVKDEVY